MPGLSLTNTDRNILDFLSKNSPPGPAEFDRVRLTPGNIAMNVGGNSNYVSERCKRLFEAGLLDRHQDGTNPFYSVTDLGKRVWAGEVDPADLDVDLDE